jgi:hypothetical protein
MIQRSSGPSRAMSIATRVDGWPDQSQGRTGGAVRTWRTRQRVEWSIATEADIGGLPASGSV